MTISDQLARHAHKIGDSVAFGYDDIRMTYRELDERASRLANALRDRGVGPGDRVAVLGYNTLEIIETYFAGARLGAICVPINFRLVADEVAYVLADCEPTVTIVHGPLAALMGKAREIAGHDGACLVYDGELEGAEQYEDAMAHGAPDVRRTPGGPRGAGVHHVHLRHHGPAQGRRSRALPLRHPHLQLHAARRHAQGRPGLPLRHAACSTSAG